MSAITKVWEFPRRALITLIRMVSLVYIVLDSMRTYPAPLTAIVRLALVMHRGKEAPVLVVNELDEDGLATVTIQIEVNCFDEDDIELFKQINEEEDDQ